MTLIQVPLRLLIGVAVVGGIVVLSGVVWLARQPSRRARVLILTQGGPPSRTVHPNGSDTLQGAWRLFFSCTHSLSPTTPVWITQTLDERRPCCMLKAWAGQRLRNLCPAIEKGECIKTPRTCGRAGLWG
jgi:hypothetical protein